MATSSGSISQSRRITPLAFLLRFTPDERVAIDLASIGNTVQAATVRMYLQNVNLARYVDLDDPNTLTGLQAMEASGLLSAGRADQIISAAVQPGESA